MEVKSNINKKEKESLELFLRLMRSTDIISDKAAKIVREYGLSYAQFGVLETLFHVGPLCQKDLANKHLTTNGNITQIIDKMEYKKWVKRVKSKEDRRKFNIELTKTGSRLIESSFPDFAGHISKILNPLSATDKKSLGKLLEKFSETVENQ
ncbi:MAG: MarR family transcriptional regulator [Leptospirales bacterium]